ncbi:response regulator transcription factor [Streptomyces sp. NK08204]|uniref:response regulator transcription factor n=1 Tax=Streptomyces sp. NK08204 TaxID=2873260 RepID=UPI001CED2D3E|nr:LuxR C-terminal-related transcriptional regulator [Streptomyces sp. NK08204]
MTATLPTVPALAAATVTALSAPPGVPRIRIRSARDADRLRTLARRAGLACTSGPEDPACPPHEPGTVTVLVADDAERALRDVRRAGPLLVVCDSVTRSGLLRAVRAGAVVLRSADLTEETLLAGVRRAGHPHPSIPYPVLSHLLTAGPEHGGPALSGTRPALTARQTSVLCLLAEGHANADIARLLRCSEHTVKNVVYEVMARLQARNRAHAVAHALRHGLI